ncbi:hypothetical protein [Enterococcus rivorum]|uniref:ATPase V n=1 Tax=Enterococcus rivorum TaxID=762845 RepID=A0A1E5KT56_9ENTE|nr:hypothetical protein [Enterococcus rivorum]MBP2098103.1 V/A-type H+-transporting ATPase subunit E [Enterococcus rivorum]OEH81041.1 hypothetical protein BCR26_05900 [Enterococcus rivorum]
MDAIEKIVEQILEKGQTEIQDFEKIEKKRIDENSKAQQEALVLQETTLIQKNEVKAKKNFKQKQNRQQLEIRQGTLNRKQEYLESLFAEAVSSMNAWSEPEFQTFVKQSVAQLPITGEAFISLGELSQGKINQKWLDDNQTAQLKLILKDETIGGQGGVVVAQSGVEYNFLFASLVQEIQKQESYTIAEMLFK